MKKILIILTALLGVINTFSQNTQNDEETQFRRDYKFFYVRTPDTKKWSELKEGNSTFLFNINTNSDVKVYWESGEKEVFRKVSKIEDGKTDDNIKYQSFKVLDEKGNEIYLFLYEDNRLLLSFDEESAMLFSN